MRLLPVTAGKIIWRNGGLVEIDPKVGISLPPFAQGLNYARGAFDGIRATLDGEDSNLARLFALKEHVQRSLATLERLNMEISLSPEGLAQAVVDVVLANFDLLRTEGSVYVRPLFLDTRSIISPQGSSPVEVIVTVAPLGEYVPRGDLRITLASFLRTGDLGGAKATANYAAYSREKSLAEEIGAHDVIGVTTGYNGRLLAVEATTTNIFVVLREGKNPVIVTPALSVSALPGVTRQCVLEFARHLDLKVREEDLDLGQIPFAEEIFLTGTASHVASATHFGRHRLNRVIGASLNAFLHSVMAGEMPAFRHLNTPVRRVEATAV